MANTSAVFHTEGILPSSKRRKHNVVWKLFLGHVIYWRCQNVVWTFESCLTYPQRFMDVVKKPTFLYVEITLLQRLHNVPKLLSNVD